MDRIIRWGPPTECILETDPFSFMASAWILETLAAWLMIAVSGFAFATCGIEGSTF